MNHPTNKTIIATVASVTAISALNPTDELDLTQPSKLGRVTNPTDELDLTQPSKLGRVTNPTDELDLTQPSKLGRVTNPTDELDLTQPSKLGLVPPTRPNPTVDWKLVYRVTITLSSVAAAGWCAMSPLFYLHSPQHLFLQIAANDLPLISMSIAFTVTVTWFNSRNLILCTLATVGSVACALVI